MKKTDYTELAKDYDEIRYIGRKNYYINLSYMSCLKSLLPHEKMIKILDVGCGTGRGVSFLAGEGYKVTGLDYTMDMLKLCREKVDDTLFMNLVRGDSGSLPFSEDSFDCIISLNFLHLFLNEVQKDFIDEMVRVLKPNGVLICEFDNYHRGLVAGKRTLKTAPTLNLNRYSDFSYLFSNPKLKINKIRGTSLPYMWRIFQFMPNVGSSLEVFAYIRPFSLIAPRCMVKAEKIL